VLHDTRSCVGKLDHAHLLERMITGQEGRVTFQCDWRTVPLQSLPGCMLAYVRPLKKLRGPAAVSDRTDPTDSASGGRRPAWREMGDPNYSAAPLSRADRGGRRSEPLGNGGGVRLDSPV
jgi:hypothetical protein